jgi:nucleotide-binding universal stress UspA family protein
MIMGACFNTILVPVDFSTATLLAIEKALELSSNKSTIHLLYVQNHLAVLPVFPASLLLRGLRFFEKQDKNDCAKLADLKENIIKKNPAVQVELTMIKDTSVKKAIIDKARDTEADLIILGRNYKATRLPFFNQVLPIHLAKEAPCAVLTVAPKDVCGTIKTVVVPMIGDATYNKMGVIAALSSNSKLNVHLVMFTDTSKHQPESAPSSLLLIYQWLKTSLRCQVQYNVLRTHNKAEATLTYARSVNADVILIDTEVHTKANWAGRHITSLLQPKSGISVLAVQSTGPLISY